MVGFGGFKQVHVSIIVNCVQRRKFGIGLLNYLILVEFSETTQLLLAGVTLLLLGGANLVGEELELG